MRPVVSRYGPAAAASGDSTLLSLDYRHYYNIKRVKIVNNTTATITAKMGINGTADANLLFPAVAIPKKQMIDQKCDDNMTDYDTPDTLQINASAAGLSVTVFYDDYMPHL